MKIIFLDIDGVLNVRSQEWDEFGSVFNEHLVDNLSRVIDATGADIVISSTWRFSGLNAMQKMWGQRGLPGRVVDITPDGSRKGENGLWLGCMRGDEIADWLSKHPEVTSFVILDDDDDMLDEQLNNFIQTSDNTEHSDHVEGYGLTKECADVAIAILNA